MKAPLEIAKSRETDAGLSTKAAHPSRILVVDDEPAMLDLYRALLSESSDRIETALSGPEAIEKVREQSFDTVVSDIRMPGMTGLDLFRAIREIDPHVPVVLITAGPTLESAIEAVELGALRYLVKPLEGNLLRSAVDTGIELCRKTRGREDVPHETVVPSVPPLVDPFAEEARFQSELVRNRLLAQALVNVGKTINSMADLRAVFHFAIEQTVRVSGGISGCILLRDEQGALTLSAHKSMQSELRSTVQRTASRTMALAAIQRHEAILAGSEGDSAEFLPAAAVGKITAICAPIEARDSQPVGAIYVQGRCGQPFFGDDGLAFMEGIASQLGIAVQNFRLLEKTAREQRQREKLSRYFSEAVVADIIAENTTPKMGGESRVVTVLFSDLRGSTSLLERLRPTEAIEMLNDYFTEIVDEILTEDGTLDKFTGDGIMALWNAPRDQPDHALRAIRAAVRIQARLPALRMRWRDEGRSFATFTDDLVAGIGIHTGEVVVGNIGSPKRMEYTAIGDPVNLAARIQGISPGGEVLITQETLLAAGENVFSEPLEPVSVKGKTQRIAVHRVLGVF